MNVMALECSRRVPKPFPKPFHRSGRTTNGVNKVLINAKLMRRLTAAKSPKPWIISSGWHLFLPLESFESWIRSPLSVCSMP